MARVSQRFSKNPKLLPPFDKWPRWAVDVDIELSDWAGFISGDDVYDQDDPEVKNALQILEAMRGVLRAHLEEG